ncbi:MAG: regulatory protein RecX [Deltaproteobacteria bacterium]|nr:regulatory protein RecX [Deltaproteobacteria bacterium]
MSSKQRGSPEEALNRALRFLGYRPRSEAEVRDKLSHLGFSQPVVETTLERLRHLKILNDEIFARDWTRGRVEERGYGPLRIERELRQKGIDKALIAEVVRETFGQESGRERAKKLLERRFKDKDLSDTKTQRRAIAFLQRRGYRDSVIAEVLRMPEG